MLVSTPPGHRLGLLRPRPIDEARHRRHRLERTPDGEWYCFEVSPAPGFAYYEQNTGQPISAALAEVLRKGQC